MPQMQPQQAYPPLPPPQHPQQLQQLQQLQALPQAIPAQVLVAAAGKQVPLKGAAGGGGTDEKVVDEKEEKGALFPSTPAPAPSRPALGRTSPPAVVQLQKESVAVGSLLQLAATAALINNQQQAAQAQAQALPGAGDGNLSPPLMSQQWSGSSAQTEALRLRREKRRANSAPPVPYDTFSRLRNLPR